MSPNLFREKRKPRTIFGRAFGGACIAGVVMLGVDCRQGEPTTEPKTPPNSPIPKIERKEEEPKTPPPLRVGDAG